MPLSPCPQMVPATGVPWGEEVALAAVELLLDPEAMGQTPSVFPS